MLRDRLRDPRPVRRHRERRALRLRLGRTEAAPAAPGRDPTPLRPLHARELRGPQPEPRRGAARGPPVGRGLAGGRARAGPVVRRAPGHRQDPPGRGADARARRGRRRARVLFWEQRELLKTIQATFDEAAARRESDVLAPVLDVDVLVLDDLGASRTTPWARERAARPDHRSATTRSYRLILTTNLALGDEPVAPRTRARAQDAPLTLRDRLGDALLSRLYEMCHIVRMTGKDYRAWIVRANLRNVGPEGAAMSAFENLRLETRDGAALDHRRPTGQAQRPRPAHGRGARASGRPGDRLARGRRARADRGRGARVRGRGRHARDGRARPARSAGLLRAAAPDARDPRALAQARARRGERLRAGRAGASSRWPATCGSPPRQRASASPR